MNDRLADQLAQVYGKLDQQHDAQREQMLAVLHIGPQTRHLRFLPIRRNLFGAPIMSTSRRTIRLIPAAVAIGLLIVMGFWIAGLGARPQIALGEALKKMSQVQTLHFEIIQDGARAEAWAKRPNMLRIEHEDGKIEVSNGPDLWEVHTKDNKAVRRPSFYYQNAVKSGKDVMELFVEPFNDSLSGFMSQMPERVKRDGLTLDVYRLSFEQDGVSVTSEIILDVKTQILSSVEVMMEGAKDTTLKMTILDYDQPIDDDLFTFIPLAGMNVSQKAGIANGRATEEPAPVPGSSPDAAGGSSLSGRIVWASNGKATGGATVSIFGDKPAAPGVQPERYVLRATTNIDGRWQIDGVPAGTVELNVRSWEFDWPAMPQFEGNRGTSERPRVLVDGRSIYDGLDYEVHKPDDTFFARIQIDVTDEDGNPVDKAYARLVGKTSSSGLHARSRKNGRSSQECSGPDGKFDAPDIWPTKQPVRVSVGREGSLYAFSGAQTDPFTIESGKTYRFDMVLPFPRTINLTITDPQGQPLEGVLVQAFSADTGLSTTATVSSDADGLAVLSGMAPSEKIVVALKRLADEALQSKPRHFAVAPAKATTLVSMTAPSGRDPESQIVVFDERPVRIEGVIDGQVPESTSIWVQVPQPEDDGNCAVPRTTPILLASGIRSTFVLDGFPAGDVELVVMYPAGSGHRCHGYPFHGEPGHNYRVRIQDDQLEVLEDTTDASTGEP